MVQGATQTAARFPELLRMYKAPPPEISSEQFYETDERRGFARGFSIQTISPLPIGWAEHVLAEGHWGQSLREYMRDYNHWTVLGILAEFLPLPENRVTLADETDAVRHAGRAVQLQPVRERPGDRPTFAKRILHEIWDGAGARTRSRSTGTPTSSAARAWASRRTDSVVDANHRVWEVDNLFVVDGSVLPTQGAANPALAIMALADRCASLLDGKARLMRRPRSRTHATCSSSCSASCSSSSDASPTA